MAAIFHLKSQIVKRSAQRSTVACASYRAGVDLYDEREKKTHSFAREDRVAHAEILPPDFAKEWDWVADRGQLWNSLELFEKRKDAQLCQELEVALPHELPKRLQIKLLKGFIEDNFTSKGFPADFVIHHAPIGKPDNDHSHIMIPLRALDPDSGDWRKKKDRAASKEEFGDTRDAEIERLRASWAKHVNAALKDDGIAHRVDHRSFERQGITEKLPTIHEGRAGREMEARGELSDRMRINREIRQINQRILEEIKARAIQAGNAVKRAAAAIGMDFAPAQAPKKPEPAPAPIVAAPEPIKPPVMPPPAIRDVEAEKRKKAAREAAWRHHQGGGGGVGG
jgi:ATP-dependent exoDNAse (exonuclease V) alpha subunit